MNNLDQNNLNDILELLNATTSTNPEIQNKNYEILEKYSQFGDFSLYLLYLINLPDINIDLKTIALILMKKSIFSIGIEYRKIFKENFFKILSPFLNFEPSPFTSLIAALIATTILEFGINIFPDINNILFHLLSNVLTQKNGLSILYELLLKDIEIKSDFIHLLPQFLDEDFIILTLQISILFSKKYPELIKENILNILFSNLENLNEEILILCLEIVSNLMKVDNDLNYIEFAKYCIINYNENVVLLSISLFQDNENLPYDIEIIDLLYDRLGIDLEITDNNISYQSSESLLYLSKLYPNEVLNQLNNLISLNISSKDIISMRKVLRSISIISNLIDDVSDLFNVVLNYSEGNFNGEIAYCLTKLAIYHPKYANLVHENLYQLLNSNCGSNRMQGLRFLSELYSIVQPDISFFSQLFNSKSSQFNDELFLYLNTISDFIENCSNFLINNINLLLIEKINLLITNLPEFDLIYPSCLSILEKCLLKDPNFINYISIQNLISKFLDLINFNKNNKLLYKIINLLSALFITKNELNIQLFDEIWELYINKLINLFKSNMIMTKMCIWAFIPLLIKYNSIFLEIMIENSILNVFNDDPLEIDHDLVGNIGFTYFEVLLNYPLYFEKQFIKDLIIYLIKSLEINQDLINQQNICCFLSIALFQYNEILIEKENVDLIHSIISSIDLDFRKIQCSDFLSTYLNKNFL